MRNSKNTNKLIPILLSAAMAMSSATAFAADTEEEFYDLDSEVVELGVTILDEGSEDIKTPDDITVCLDDETSSGEISLMSSALTNGVTYTSSAIEPKVQIYDDDYELVEGTDYTLSYEDNVNVGTAYIIITYMGNYDGSAKVSFTIVAREVDDSDITVSGINTSYTYTGSEITVNPVILVDSSTRLYEGTDYELSYDDNVNAGTVTVTITFIGNYDGEITQTFEITAISISTGDIDFGTIANQTYTGDEITPEPTVEYNGTVLVSGTDFDFEYSNNVNVGTSATVKAVFKGNYSGSDSTTFTIVALESTALNTEITGLDSSYTYTGSEITPDPVVTVDGATLTEGVDYDLSYADNTDVGTATITITFKGNYDGSTSATFTISAQGITTGDITFSAIEDQVYTGSAITPEPTLEYNGTALTSGVDYDLSYSNNVSVGTATVTATFKGNYSGSDTTTFSIVAQEIVTGDIEFSTIEDQTYTGSALTPVPTVTYNGTLLTSGMDYDLVYNDNVNAGTATVTANFKGNYSGSDSTTFTINPKEATSLNTTISEITSKTYTGSAITVSPIILVDSSGVTEGTDYDLSYDDNVNVGTVTVTITFKGNYTGALETTFEITSSSFTADHVIIEDIEDVTYDRTAHEPEPVVYLDGTPLTKDVDYELSYENNTNAGTATVYVTGIGNYSGTLSKTFTINPKSGNLFIIVILDPYQN